MRDWFTTELLVSLLLVTTFVCVGLLALWAANSPRHWFLRALVVFAVLAPLQAIPAYDLYLTFAIAIALAWFTLIAIRWGRRRRQRKLSGSTPATASPRFSLRSALFVTASLAIALAVGTHVPSETWRIWPAWMISAFMLWIGIFPIWLTANPHLGRWLRICFFLTSSALLAFGFNIWGGALFTLISFTVFATQPNTIPWWHWFGVTAVAQLLLYVGNAIGGLRIPGAGRRVITEWAVVPPSHHLRPVLFSIFLVAISFAPIGTIWELLHPTPAPLEQVPMPNGIEEIVKLGQRLEQCAVLKLDDQDVIDFDRLTVAVAAQQADYAELSRVLEVPGWIAVRYDNTYLDTDDLSSRRRVCRFLSAKCDVEIRAKRMDDAIATELAMLKLADRFHQGGVAVDFLVASACDGIAHDQIYKSIELFDKQQCAVMQQQLASVESHRRGIEDVLLREHIYMQRTMGWVSQLVEFIGRLASDSPAGWDVDEAVANSYHRTLAIERMLILKLAIRAYQLDHGVPPTQLAQLVPTYISTIPIDPFDPTGQPLRYRVTADGYALYSVDRDGNDDAARPAPEDVVMFPVPEANVDGDLTLEATFAEEPTTTGATESEDDSNNDADGNN